MHTYALSLFSRQNLQGAPRLRRAASARTTLYGQEVVIQGVDHAASMHHQVHSTVRLSETQQRLCSYVTDPLQGAFNAPCNTGCASLLHAHSHRHCCVRAIIQVQEVPEEEYLPPVTTRKRSASSSNSSNKRAPTFTSIVDKVCVFVCIIMTTSLCACKLRILAQITATTCV
jgi:hypothetical protein